MTWSRCPKIGVLLNKLTKVFSANFKLNVARVRGLSFLIHAVLLHRTVNLVILSTCDDGRDVSHESRYRRLQDFFLNARVCYQSVVRFQLSRLLKPKEGYTLSMDRTNWRGLVAKTLTSSLSALSALSALSLAPSQCPCSGQCCRRKQSGGTRIRINVWP